MDVPPSLPTYIFSSILSSAIGTNYQTATITSTRGPEVELHDPRRRELLQALNDALSADTIRQTAWACLCLCDVDKLVDLLALAQTSLLLRWPFFQRGSHCKNSPTCRMIKLILPRWIANSIEGLNENDTPLPLLLHRILPLHYSSNPQHRAVVDKSEIAVEASIYSQQGTARTG
jgi:hypothetical protein